MLADAGETLRSYASGFSARPDTRAIVTNPLRTRTAQAPDILSKSVDGAFGTDQNIPELIDTTHAAINAQAKPFYDDFHGTPILMNDQIKTVLRRIKTSLPSAVSGAQKLAAGDGHELQFKLHDVDNPMTAMTGVKSQVSEPVPMGIEFDYLKRFVDNAAKAEKPGSNEQRIYGNLARDLRNTVDRSLSPDDPGMSSWAQARAITAPGFDFREAVDQGRTAFAKNVSPDQLAYDMKGDTVGEKAGRLIGARSQIADAMGNKATAFGEKGDTAARQMFNSQYAKEKVDMLALPHRADSLHNTVARENLYAQTADAVLGGPPTALRLTFDKRFPTPGDKTASPFHGVKGMMMHPVQKIVELATRNAVTERSIRTATDAAKMLVLQGAERDAVVHGLRSYLSKKDLSTKHRVAIMRIANTLAHGARQLAIGSRPYATPGDRPL